MHLVHSRLAEEENRTQPFFTQLKKLFSISSSFGTKNKKELRCWNEHQIDHFAVVVRTTNNDLCLSNPCKWKKNHLSAAAAAIELTDIRRPASASLALTDC